MKSPEKLKPRKLPSQQRAERRVADIIAAYRRLLDGDARRISTNSIAQEAGIPVSSLYQYFPNKESIAFAVYRQWAEEALDVLREQRRNAERADSWRDFLSQNADGFFNSEISARIVHQLGPVMENSPELKAAQRDYLAQMANIVVDTVRSLGSDWPDAPLRNVITLLIELNTTAFRHIARQSGRDASETFSHWQMVGRALLQRCIETPYATVDLVAADASATATKRARRRPEPAAAKKSESA